MSFISAKDEKGNEIIRKVFMYVCVIVFALWSCKQCVGFGKSFLTKHTDMANLPHIPPKLYLRFDEENSNASVPLYTCRIRKTDIIIETSFKTSWKDYSTQEIYWDPVTGYGQFCARFYQPTFSQAVTVGPSNQPTSTIVGEVMVKTVSNDSRLRITVRIDGQKLKTGWLTPVWTDQ